MYFFNSIYYYLYNKSKRGNAVPEIPVITFISFFQANNIILCINIFLIIGNYNIPFLIHYAFAILVTILTIFNHYYYKGKGKKILLQEKKYSIRRHGLWVDVYSLLSIFLAGYTFYIYREYFWKPFLD